MKVNCYTVTGTYRDGGSSPRVWRIMTDDGVYWLAEDGGRSHLVTLPIPLGNADAAVYLDDDSCGPCEALALAAETEAACRWVRRGPALVIPESTADHP